MKTLVFLLAMVIASAVGHPSAAQAEGAWSTMIPNHFPDSSPANARNQCLRAAAISATDALTPLQCEQLFTMLTNGSCSAVFVPDGTKFAYLGEPERILQGVTKQTGRLDRAVSCDLGNGIIAYYFVGVPGQSCNNLGIRILRRFCPQVSTDTMSYGSPGHYQQGVTVNGCLPLNVPSLYLPGRPSGVTTSIVGQCFYGESQ